jgi:hypothetical protein
MAWIYFQESVDSVSLSGRGSELSHTVRETDTLRLCCCREWLLTNSTERRYGTTLHRSEAPCYQVSTSSLVDSHVRTSALQELVAAWVVSEADFMRTSKDLSKKQSHLSSSLKTSLQSGHADLVVWCGDFPRSGMILGGQLFLPQALELHTKETDGSYLPTPTSQSYGSNKGGAAGRIGKERFSLDTMARKNLWPTPMSSDYKAGWGDGDKNRSSPRLQTIIGGRLNPTWVEWLMNFPLGWTELSASAMQWFRSRRKQLSRFSQELGAET